MGIVKITELKLKKSLYKIKLKNQIITGNKNYNIIIVGKQIKGLKEPNKKQKTKKQRRIQRQFEMHNSALL